MSKFTDCLVKANPVLYSVVLCIIIFAIRVFVYGLKYIFAIPDYQFRERLINKDFDISINLIANTLIFAPILETLVFQTLFFLALKKMKINRWVIVLLSGIAFGALHNYSIFYMINAGLTGFVFMYMYILRAEINNKPLLSTIVAHSVINLISIVALFVSHFNKYGTININY